MLLPFHPLTNIEISEYYKNEPRFNGVYSRNNLPNKIKKGAYIINLDEYENTGTHWVSLFVKDNSYLFVNGRQELKFKAKTDQLVKEKLCMGNLSDQWTTIESEKTGTYGEIYDFVVDYEQISGVKTTYDMHRYLIIKHNINP